MKFKEFSLMQAFFLIVVSTMVTFFIFFSLYEWSAKIKKRRGYDPKYNISTIIQKSLDKELLNTSYLADLLDLSYDKPKNIYLFDVGEAQKRLENFNIIKKVKIKKVYPSALLIDYEMRKPIAKIADYDNLAIDEEKVIFYLHPYYSPKELPYIYLDIFLNEEKMKSPLKDKRVDLAFNILRLLKKNSLSQYFQIKKIDGSKAFLSSFGKREVVVFLDEEIYVNSNQRECVYIFPKILRLSAKHYEKQLDNYFLLSKNMRQDYQRQLKQRAITKEKEIFQTKIIDLRISDVAYIER